MDLMSSLDPSDSGYDDDESEESTKRTPMKKRRVSMKAMTALRFSTTGGRLTGMTLTGGDFIGTGEQQQEQQQQQQQGEEGPIKQLHFFFFLLLLLLFISSNICSCSFRGNGRSG